MDRTIIPELITTLTGVVSSVSIMLVVKGEVELAIRLIFLCLALDTLDGLVARALNASSERGEFLDRLFDRLYQVMVPAIIYAQITDWNALSVAYSSLIITISFWRLARRVPSREYFAGLPLFVHTIVIISGFLSGFVPPPWVMILLCIASAIPVKYYRRRTVFSHTENKGTYWHFRLAIPLLLSIAPYEKIGIIFLVIEVATLAYVLLGWIPFLFREGPAGVVHRKKEKVYTL